MTQSRLSLSWPTAVVVIVSIVALAATAVLGPLVGMDPETLHLVLGAEGTLGAVLAGLMRALLVPRPQPRAEPIWAQGFTPNPMKPDPEYPVEELPEATPATPRASFRARGRVVRREPPDDAGPGLALLLIALGGTASLAGCSSGPQLPVVTTPIHISCTWTVDAGSIEDSDCMIDRSSAAPATATTGVRTETRDISPSVSVPVGIGQ